MTTSSRFLGFTLCIEGKFFPVQNAAEWSALKKRLIEGGVEQLRQPICEDDLLYAAKSKGAMRSESCYYVAREHLGESRNAMDEMHALKRRFQEDRMEW